MPVVMLPTAVTSPRIRKEGAKMTDTRICPVCGRETPREDMDFTYDCHGIPYRLVCYGCYDKLMDKGYDGEHYTEADECLDWDY